MNIIVYTAMTPGYKPMKPVLSCNRHLRHIAFATAEDCPPDLGWERHDFPWGCSLLEEHSLREAEFLKTLPMLHLPPCDVSVWLDGDKGFNAPLAPFVSEHLADPSVEFVTFAHDRIPACALTEADASRYRAERPALLEAQRDVYEERVCPRPPASTRQW